jgi:hypothetical protein
MKVLSFACGIVLVAVVVSAAIKRNPALQAEIQRQAETVLEATREVVTGYKNISEGINKLSGAIGNREPTKEEGTTKHLLTDETYNKMWAKVEEGVG